MSPLVEPFEILLVEDNPADADITCEYLEEAPVRLRVHVARDGVDALRFVRREPPFEDAPRPSLILLDLGLPRKDGRQVLAELKQDPTLRCIPVVVLSSSDADTDVNKSYNLHANAYVTKPVDLDEYGRVFQRLEQFWLGVAQLPVA